ASWRPPGARGWAGPRGGRRGRPWGRPSATMPPAGRRSPKWSSPSTTRRPWTGSHRPWSGSWAPMAAELEGVQAGAGGHLAAGGLLERIVAWAGQVVGTPNGYICLIEPETGEMVLRLGTGAYA